jgi:hypothetical protein
VSVLASLPILRTAKLKAVAEFRALNLFDANYAYNFGNPFSGTHFGAPRSARLDLRLALR